MTGEKRSRGRGEAAGAEGEVEVEGVILTWIVVLQKVTSEANPKVRNHREGPY